MWWTSSSSITKNISMQMKSSLIMLLAIIIISIGILLKCSFADSLLTFGCGLIALVFVFANDIEE